MRGTTLTKKKDYLFINLNPCKETICTLCPPGKNFKRRAWLTITFIKIHDNFKLKIISSMH